MLLVAVALIAPASADAALPDPAAVLATSRVPVVHGMTISYGECHIAIPAAGCSLGNDTIIVDGDLLATNGDPALTVPPMLFHEAGHVFAAHVGPGVVHRFARITHTRVTVGERFADAYMACALGWVPRPTFWNGGPNFPTGYGYEPSRRVHRVVCAMFARAGARL